MEFECQITRSCIYWADDKRERTDLMINAESLAEAIKKLNQEAWSLEVRSGASKLVQDVLIKIDGYWDVIRCKSILELLETIEGGPDR